MLLGFALAVDLSTDVFEGLELDLGDVLGDEALEVEGVVEGGVVEVEAVLAGVGVKDVSGVSLALGECDHGLCGVYWVLDWSLLLSVTG